MPRNKWALLAIIAGLFTIIVSISVLMLNRPVH
jgi:hypothetical protein